MIGQFTGKVTSKRCFTFSSDLNDETDVDCQHDHAVEEGEKLGEGQLHLGVSVVACETEEEERNDVVGERLQSRESEHYGHRARDHHVDTTWTNEGSNHDCSLESIV